MAAPTDSAPPLDVKRQCEEFAAQRRRREDEIRSRYEKRKETIKNDIEGLQGRLRRLEEAEGAELAPSPFEVFIDKTCQVLAMVKTVQTRKGVIDAAGAIEEWGELALDHLDTHSEIIRGVRAGLVEHTRLQEAQLRARGSGKARGYKARDSTLGNLCTPEVSYDGGTQWIDVDDDELAGPGGEPAEEYARNFLELEGEADLEDWDMKECRVSGTLTAHCMVLRSKGAPAED